jgi:hypothetical protein
MFKNLGLKNSITICAKGSLGSLLLLMVVFQAQAQLPQKWFLGMERVIDFTQEPPVIGLTTNVVKQDALHQVSIYGLDPGHPYDILLFDIHGKVYYRGPYTADSPVFPSVCVPSMRPGLFYLHLSNAQGGIHTFKIAVLE